MLGACHPFEDKGQVNICRRRSSPILEYGGASCESSPSEAQSRKVVRLEEMKIVFIDLKCFNAQGKGMILIGFLFYRSHDVSGETGL